MIMIYITKKLPPAIKQMSLEDLLFGDGKSGGYVINDNITNTRTYEVLRVKKSLEIKPEEALRLIRRFESFNLTHLKLCEENRVKQYVTFYVAKRDKGFRHVFKKIYEMQDRYIGIDTKKLFSIITKKTQQMLQSHPRTMDEPLQREVARFCSDKLCESGFKMTPSDYIKIVKSSFRRIDKPNEQLMIALRELKNIFEFDFGALYHTSAYAYIQGRQAKMALEKHQKNESRWFAKYDFTNFFGSVTEDFILNTLEKIYPFSEILEYTAGRNELKKAISLCVLDGVLPQGTPISPMLTNLIMIPFDYIISNTLRDFNNQHFVYTRYADDILISSRYHFDHKLIERYIIGVLEKESAPLCINSEKTRYGSRAGANWNLGIMLNKENEITIGWRTKQKFRAMLASYIMDKSNSKAWDYSRVSRLNGYINYYRMIEGDRIDDVIKHVESKFNVSVLDMIAQDLRV